MTWASCHTKLLQKILWVLQLHLCRSVFLLAHVPESILFEGTGLITLHLAHPRNALQMLPSNINLPEVHPSFLWLTVPFSHGNEGEKMLCPRTWWQSHHSPCTCTLSEAWDICPIPFHPILPYPIPSLLHTDVLQWSRKWSWAILSHTKLFSLRIERTTYSHSQSLQRDQEVEGGKLATCSLNMMGRIANSAFLLEWHF